MIDNELKSNKTFNRRTTMLEPDQMHKLDNLFHVLKQLSETDRQKIFSAGQVTVLPDEQMLMQQNQQCQFIPLVISGKLRIFKLSPTGREMTLYRIGPGETCLISIACQLKGEDFPAMAQVEGATQLFMLPSRICHEILDHSLAWKDYLITSMYGHLTDVMQTLEAVAFDRTDHRLILWLLEKVHDKPGMIRCTHEAIAVELGTAREVVSRLLGELKNKGAVKLGRGKIEVTDLAQLKILSED
jgi:CRP/FNR family transcriptional regulator